MTCLEGSHNWGSLPACKILMAARVRWAKQNQTGSDADS